MRIKELSRLIVLIATIMAILFPARAQEEMTKPLLSGKEAKTAAKTMTSGYTDWQTATLSGKLELEHLLVSPSVKIFMQKGKRIIISLRVPLLGEVGTLDVNETEFTIVNKMKKTYCREELNSLMSDLPITLSDLQDLFLGRIFLPGEGTLSMTNYEKAEIFFEDESGGWYVIPKEQPTEYEAVCGYYTLPDGRTEGLFVTTTDRTSQATATYEYDNERRDLDMTIRYNGKDREFIFSIRKTEWNTKALTPAKIDESYKRVSLSEFFRSMK